jgi:hypothetical protein
MVCCRRLLPLTSLLTLSLACQPPAQQAMTDMQRTALADSVKQLAKGFVAAFRNLDPSVVVDQLEINEQYVENGFLFRRGTRSSPRSGHLRPASRSSPSSGMTCT